MSERSAWVPGQPRVPSAHGTKWSKKDRDRAIDAVTSLIMEGAGVAQACRKVGVSERTFEKWRYADAELGEFIIGIYTARESTRGKMARGRYNGRNGIYTLSKPATKKFNEYMAAGLVKAAWVFHYDLTKDRVLSCRACGVRVLDVMGWLEEDEVFADEVKEIEAQKQWMVEDIYWRRGALFKDSAALKGLVSGTMSKGRRADGTQNVAGIGAPEVHFHVSANNSSKVSERLEGILGGNGKPKQIPDSSDSARLLASGSGSGGDGPSDPDGNGEGALHQ